MDILTYINRMNQIYGNGPAPAPRYNTQQYLQGGRVGYKEGDRVIDDEIIKKFKLENPNMSMSDMASKLDESYSIGKGKRNVGIDKINLSEYLTRSIPIKESTPSLLLRLSDMVKAALVLEVVKFA